MAVTIQDILNAKKQSDTKFEGNREIFRGKIISVERADTTVSPYVEGKTGFVWVQSEFGGAYEVFNREVRVLVGLEVLVGRSPKPPNRYEILQWNDSIIVDDPNYSGTPYLRNHAPDHEQWDGGFGGDAINVYTRMFASLKTWVNEDVNDLSPTTFINVSSLLYVNEYEFVGYNGDTGLDISSYFPAVGYKRYLLVYLDRASNTIGFKAGYQVPNTDVYTPAYPIMEDDIIPSAIILLDDQTGITDSDIVDARILIGAEAVVDWSQATSFLSLGDLKDVDLTTTPPVAGNFLMYDGHYWIPSSFNASSANGAWPQAGKVKISNTEYNTITAAIIAAASGDVIKIGEGTWAENLVIAKDITLIGISSESTIISQSAQDNTILITSPNVYLANLTIQNNKNTAGTTTAINYTLTSGSDVNANNCIISCPNLGAGNGYGIGLDSSSAYIYLRLLDCTVNGKTYDINVTDDTNAPDIDIIDGVYSNNISPTFDLYGGANASYYLYKPQLWGDGTTALGGLASYYGQYIDSFGVERYPAKTEPTGGDVLLWSSVNGRWEPGTAPGGGWPYSHVLTVDQTDSDADYSTISAALLAASDGDVILVGAGTYNESFSLDAEVAVVGVDRDKVIISQSTSDNAVGIAWGGTRLANLTIQNTKDTGSTTSGLNVQIFGLSTTTTVTLDNVKIENSNASGVGHGIILSAVSKALDIELLDVIVACSGYSSGYAVNVSDASNAITAKLYGGSYTGIVNTLNFISNSTCTLFYPSLTNNENAIAGAGTYLGQYLDGNGVSRYIADVDPNTDWGILWSSVNGRWEPQNLSFGGTAAGGWPFSNVLTVDPTDPNADYSTIAGAIAGANAGDVIMIGAGTYAESLTISKAITLWGTGHWDSIISQGATAVTITIATNNVTLHNLSVESTYKGASDAIGVKVNSSITADIYDVYSTAEGQSSTGNKGRGYDNNGTLNLFGCYGDGTNDGMIASGYAVYVSGTTKIYGGRYDGASYSVYISGAYTVQLFELPVLGLSGGIGGTTTSLYGQYADKNFAALRYTQNNAPNDGDVPIWSTSANAWVPGASSGSASDYILLQDQQTSGTNGGPFISGAWRTRVLNTEVSDVGGHCALASNQFTLVAGTYIIKATAPAYYVDRHRIALYDVTGTAILAYGTSEYCPTAGGTSTISVLAYRFTIASSNIFTIVHRCNVTNAGTAAMGVASSMGTEIYCQVELWKVA